MTQHEFNHLLEKAVAASVAFARSYVVNDLPDTARFHVFLNQSHYGHAAAEERVYPEDNGREYPCLTAGGRDRATDCCFEECHSVSAESRDVRRVCGAKKD